MATLTEIAGVSIRKELFFMMDMLPSFLFMAE
jgi:hypothetical protein